MGRDKVTIRCDNRGVIYGDNVSDVEISGLTLISTGTQEEYYQTTLSLQNSKDIVLRDCVVSGAVYSGIEIGNSKGIF